MLPAAHEQGVRSGVLRPSVHGPPPLASLLSQQPPLQAQMWKIIPFLKSPVFSLTLKPRDTCSLALEHSLNTSCSPCFMPCLLPH